MKKTMSRILLWLLTLLLLSAPVTALAAGPGGEEPAPSEEDLMEEARDFLTRVGNKIRTGGTDLFESIRAVAADIDTEEITSRLEGVFQSTRNLTDDQLREKIRTLAEETHVSITDAQVDRLVKLCRQMEKLDGDALREKVEDIKSASEKFEDVKETAEDLGEKAGGFFQSVVAFFQRVGDLVSDLLGNGND